MTFNEPLVLVAQGYMNGEFPPLRKGDSHGEMLARRNMIRAHCAGLLCPHRACDTRHKKIKVGIALPADHYVPARIWSEDDQKVTATLEFEMNLDFADAVEDRLDYLGLNYYSGWLIKFNPWGSFFGVSVEYTNAEKREDNIYPEGLYWTVKEFALSQADHHYGKRRGRRHGQQASGIHHEPPFMAPKSGSRGRRHGCARHRLLLLDPYRQFRMGEERLRHRALRLVER